MEEKGGEGKGRTPMVITNKSSRREETHTIWPDLNRSHLEAIDEQTVSTGGCELKSRSFL